MVDLAANIKGRVDYAGLLYLLTNSAGCLRRFAGSGTRGGIRTCDFFLRREALYPLSYASEKTSRHSAVNIVCSSLESPNIAPRPSGEQL